MWPLRRLASKMVTTIASSSIVCSRAISSNTILSEKVKVDGMEFHFETSGRGSMKLLLLPGALGCSATDFGPQLKHLCPDTFTVIGFDPRGYGRSRPPDRDFPRDFYHRDAKDAARFMKALGHTSYSILGWSDGAICGLIMAAENQAAVANLVVWGGNAFVDEEDLNIYDQVRDISSWSARMRDPFIELYGEEYFEKQWHAWCDAVVKYKTDGRNGNICQDQLKDIMCPTLIIHGEKDFMVGRQHAVYLSDHIKGATSYFMPEGKHNLHIRYHDFFNTFVTNFLTGQTASTK